MSFARGVGHGQLPAAAAGTLAAAGFGKQIDQFLATQQALDCPLFDRLRVD